MKKIIYLCMVALSAGIVAFVITLARYDYHVDEQVEIEPIRMDLEKEYVSAESSIRINPEALEREEKKVVNKVEIPKKEKDGIVKNNIQEVVKEVIAKPKNETDFIKPFDGKIGREFSGEDLIYSEVLKEWGVHNGIDIIGEINQSVNAICSGKISDIKYDYRIGNSIEIENGEFVIKYACISPLESLKVGDNVKVGEKIGTLSEDVGFEFDIEPHLHLEILQAGKQVNPQNFIHN